ncbi:acyl-CoA dehydratase activase-related protein [Fusobacterium sp. MFO224]|uniref:acyl-CoA dehydratase activase-related protein n=1 Tax=Fusobacterium sp. MFO224 TaxID=3378070 RepID=UPI003851C88E
MEKLFLGIDVGSTTIKIVCINSQKEVLYSIYERHFSDVRNKLKNLLENMFEILEQKLGNEIMFRVNVTGSAGIGISKILDLSFVQEVISCIKAIETLIPHTDVAIELGGEDAKITFLKNETEQRMNGSCAGGTGAFIDQMATLLNTDAKGLNELAKNGNTIYPIASRCGVFAKTDIQPLINEGIKKEDIAISIFQAVVNQTITGLACGKKIEKKVAFLGGPLFFLSELRKRFKETLKLEEEDLIFPEDSQLFVAKGACFLCMEERKDFISFKCFIEKINLLLKNSLEVSSSLRPLFLNKKEENKFYKDHNSEKVEEIDIDEYVGDAYLGIDAGSTTIKLVLLSEDLKILYSYYSNNMGNPMEALLKEMSKLYEKIGDKIKIKSSCVTGYGEKLIKSAFNIDYGMVETMAHYRGAKHFLPSVDFILDIGGQDMKCLKIKDGVITSILLNEACSSGCGSFLETFANSLNMDILEFAKIGMKSENPCDLGTRCTVFMNSKVKQAQKEGAKLEDISAGLSYSVIKNTLYKVIKMKNNDELGDNIVVQGGTFLNNSVLRAFEIISNKKVIRPSIAGLMGAFGCAILAKEKSIKENKSFSSVLSLKGIKEFSYKTNLTRCGGCGNNCLLTIHQFKTGERFISGNRCDNFLRKMKKESKYNMVDYKYNRLFNYEPLSISQAFRGEIGIPRVLNMYESYPFWFTFFNNLGFRVIISDDSSKELYNEGIGTISSDSICYPAKIVHGHIMNLINKGVKKIFYPCVVYEQKESSSSDNKYNCPIVISYSEVIKNNMEILKEKNIEIFNPFISMESEEAACKILEKEFFKYNITKYEIKKAVNLAWKEKNRYKEDLSEKAKEILDYIEKNNKTGIVLCGRPYHIDKEINHGIPDIINSLDIPILTGDIVSSFSSLDSKLRVVDQWTYHSRLYRAATFVGKHKNLELVEFNSFSCGIDSITIDQVAEILDKYGKIHTILKIDEISNMGSIKIRLRSLLAVIEDRKRNTLKNLKAIPEIKKNEFTKKSKEEFTILAPQMSPIHFDLIETAFKSSGYNLEVLKESKEAIEEGLRYVNNDACYPAILVIGELILALKSKEYDLQKIAVLISQTGGSCRATNYISLLKKALKDAGFEFVPVLSLNNIGYEKHEGFNISMILFHKLIMAVSYGDFLMNLLYQIRPYEKVKGSTNELYDECRKIVKENIKSGNIVKFKTNVYEIIEKFLEIKTVAKEKIKVGIVGEILVKFSPCANNYLVDILEKEGCEVKVYGLMNFINYCLYSDGFLEEKFKGKFFSIKYKICIYILRMYTNVIDRALEKSKVFKSENLIEKIAKKTSKYISIGNQSGEGWFLTGEMIDFIEEGINNVICIQPFGCLPNQITGRGMMKKIKEEYPESNITAIDYDPSYSEVNQINRIKLMVSVGKKNLNRS